MSVRPWPLPDQPGHPVGRQLAKLDDGEPVGHLSFIERVTVVRNERGRGHRQILHLSCGHKDRLAASRLLPRNGLHYCLDCWHAWRRLTDG